jgi:hypothetical protein
MNKLVRGRVELVVGRLGYGKTTFAAERVAELAHKTDRRLATNGIGWGKKWTEVSDFDSLEDLRDAVLLFDEIHLWSPSVRGLMDSNYEKTMLRVFSLLRKRGICVVGTTQARTRVSTHVRQLVTSEWYPRPILPGLLHRAIQREAYDDGGGKLGLARWYSPRFSEVPIPTNAEVFLPPVLYSQGGN